MGRIKKQKFSIMKRIISFLVLSCIVLSVSAQNIPMKAVKLDKMPTNVDEFLKLRNKIAKTPQGGAAMFIIATKMYVENPDVGAKCLVIATDRSRLQTGDVYKGYAVSPMDMNRIKQQLKQYPYLPSSYFKGAKPDNGYKVKFPTKISFSSNSYSGKIAGGNLKIFVKCYGADSQRPISVVKNNKGYWKAKEWSTVIMGIRPPVVEVDDDL